MQSCNGEPELTTLEQGADEVRIEVESTTYADGDGDACRDSLTIDLDQPVGDRTVIDLSTGRELQPASS